MNPSDVAPALDLRDIHLAPATQFWPPAPGWWLLALLAGAALAFLTLWFYRRYHRLRQRRRILQELDRLGTSYRHANAPEFVTAVSTLLRRVALQRHARERVAPLSGTTWLQFLDDTGGNGQFTTGVGKLLGDGPYVPHLQEVPAEPLLALARDWITRNLGAAS
jgi:hypothetical protein